MAQSNFQGEYIFSRQEIEAAFNFTKDGKFEFYYSYGATDRTAKGTFTIEGKIIKLKSDKEPGKDFSVTHQSKSGKGYAIKIEDENKYFLNTVRCSFFTGSERHDEYTDENGDVKVEYPHCDSIFVFHTMFPDFVTRIKDETNENNHFTLALNPSLMQVSFKGIDFTIEDDHTINCMHNYLIPLEDIKFTKR